MVVEETLVDGDTEVPEVDHLGGLNIDVADINLALTLSLHREFVKDALGSLLDAEDHDLIDDLGGSPGVEVLVTDGLGHLDVGAVVVVTNLGSLVMSVVVVLTVIQVEVASGVWVSTEGISVDLEADGVVDGLEERLTAVSEVEDWEDGTASHEGALLGISDASDVDIVMGLNLELGVDIVPLGGGWEVDLDLGAATEKGVLDSGVANLGADEDIRSEHELVVQVVGHDILRELVPHGADDGETGLGGLEEEVVHVVSLGVSLVDGGEGSSLHTWALKPWLAHLEALLRVGTEEGIVDTELVELDVEVILGDAGIAWNVVTGIDDTGDTEREEHVDRELDILELGVVAASGDGTVSLGSEEEGSREKERSLLTTVTTQESLEGGALLEGTIGVVDPSVLEDITLSGHVGVVHGHADLLLVGASLVD